MPKAKLPVALASESCDEVEAAFYEAMRNADIERLMACWSDEDEVVCVHPGGPRIVGLGAIRASFEALFATGGVLARPERVRSVPSLTCEVRHVLERIEVLTGDGPRHAYAIATNVYLKTAQGWRLVVHHASPGTAEELHEVTDVPSVLH